MAMKPYGLIDNAISVLAAVALAVWALWFGG